MINRNGLLYHHIIRRMNYLENKDNNLTLELIKIINRYENKFNKSIFKNNI